jgi:pyruvate dehydrogenase E2 component (dihydrolipoamide acetyltransferase)
MPDGGLITPVLANADQVDIYSISRTWKDLVERARAKKLQPDEYSTGTFSLSNLGMFGVDQFDAILPPGQGSILAVGAARPQVVANADGMFGVKNQMKVNITCDHRIIYGADAAAFLQDLAKLIENNPQSLTM